MASGGNHLVTACPQYFAELFRALDDTQPEGFWQEDWLEKETQPHLVKIKIERDDDSLLAGNGS